eukprot:1292391-Karenia_brevis.AAC.1
MHGFASRLRSPSVAGTLAIQPATVSAADSGQGDAAPMSPDAGSRDTGISLTTPRKSDPASVPKSRSAAAASS